MARVLLVSKPVVPPWNDSSKNLARDVADGLRRHTPIVLVDGSGSYRPPRGEAEPLYRARGRYAPGFRSQLRVLRRLGLGPRADLWHFFFAPNPRTSLAGRALSLARRAKTVQTVCSRPRSLDGIARLLFADRTVVLSRSTLDALLDAGVPRARLAHVPPSVPALTPLDEEARALARGVLGLPCEAVLVLYPGDLEVGEGAARMIDALGELDDAVLVMACRAKTPAAADAARALADRARALGVADRVHWIGETPRIHALVGCVDVVALPSTDLYAKMDLPLVLLEAMWLARPVIVARGSAAAELADGAGGGVRVAEEGQGALVAAIRAALDDPDAGADARRVAELRYHPRQMIDAYEAIYDDVLGGRP